MGKDRLAYQIIFSPAHLELDDADVLDGVGVPEERRVGAVDAEVIDGGAARKRIYRHVGHIKVQGDVGAHSQVSELVVEEELVQHLEVKAYK